MPKKNFNADNRYNTLQYATYVLYYEVSHRMCTGSNFPDKAPKQHALLFECLCVASSLA